MPVFMGKIAAIKKEGLLKTSLNFANSFSCQVKFVALTTFSTFHAYLHGPIKDSTLVILY